MACSAPVPRFCLPRFGDITGVVPLRPGVVLLFLEADPEVTKESSVCLFIPEKIFAGGLFGSKEFVDVVKFLSVYSCLIVTCPKNGDCEGVLT